MLAGSSAFAADVMPANVVFNDGVVGAALTAQAGDPAAGRKVFMNRKLGNCLACHANEDMSDQSFHGEVGPALDGVADRWEAAELRGIVVNSKMMFEGTIRRQLDELPQSGRRSLELSQCSCNDLCFV